MDIAISISNRELKPAVVNFFQYENQTVTLNFTLDSYLYGDVDLRNYKAYGVTSQNGLIDMTELEMNYDSTEDKLTLAWEVQEYSLRQEGAITYQICFKENADDGENTAVFYSYKGIMINRGSVDGDNHITANYPTLLKQWLDRIQELAGTLEAGIVYIPYGENIPTSERLSGRVYFQFTDSANTKGRFEDHEGKELVLSAYLPLSGGEMRGNIILNGGDASIKNKFDNNSTTIFGGTAWDKGSHLILSGINETSNNGGFSLITADGTNYYALKGKLNGSLTWGNKNIVRSVNNTQANQSGDVTVDVGVTSVNGKKGALTAADTGCLPLSGGTMTGSLSMNKYRISGASSIELDAPSTATHGGFIDFHYAGSTEDYTSRIIEDSEGKLSVTAPNGMTINNKHIVRSIDGITATNDGNVTLDLSDKYLPLSGGKLTGAVTGTDLNLSGNIYGTTTSQRMHIGGGTDWNKGGHLALSGVNHSDNPGGFSLCASNGNAYSALIGKTDGTLTWNGDDVMTESRISSIMNSLYPVGSLYLTVNSTCPLATLISGSTWELVSQDRVLQGAGTRGTVGSTLDAGLPNITASFIGDTDGGTAPTGAVYYGATGSYGGNGTNSGTSGIIQFNASRSSSIYGNSTTVQPPAYLINVFKRTK